MVSASGKREVENSVLLGLDIGASSVKLTAIQPDGSMLAEASVPIATQSPHNGWSEQEPENWWQAACQACQAVVSQLSDPDQIAAIAFSAGAHTQVLVDGDGCVIRPAIMWNDQRASEESRHLGKVAGTEIFEITANKVNPTWTLAQMAWIKKHEPEAHGRVNRLYLAKDWLRARFSGTWETDIVDAAGTLMSDVRKHEWSRELCELIGWDASTLPPIRSSKSVTGGITRAAADATGLPEGIPIVCGSSDTAVETYGAGMVDKRIGVIKLATAGMVGVLTDEPLPNPELIQYPHIIPGKWYALAATNSCASAHRWLKESLFANKWGENGFSALDELAASVNPGSDGLFFHPYLNGERSPYWNPRLRADFVGLSFHHKAGHLVRALYEGIGYSLRDCQEVLKSSGVGATNFRITGGGVRSKIWTQAVSDILDAELEEPVVADASFGAALLAGVGIGLFDDEISATNNIEIKYKIKPIQQNTSKYKDGFGIYKSIQKSLQNTYDDIYEFNTRYQHGDDKRDGIRK